MLANKGANYHAYLLRIWRDDKQSPWRAMLIDPHTDKRIGFASLAQLYAFLDGQIATETDLQAGDGQP